MQETSDNVNSFAQGKDLWEILNKQHIRRQKSCRKRFFLRQLVLFGVYYYVNSAILFGVEFSVFAWGFARVLFEYVCKVALRGKAEIGGNGSCLFVGVT